MQKYDKALNLVNMGVKANPFLFYSEILKSQIFEEQGELDSANIMLERRFKIFQIMTYILQNILIL